MAIMLLRIDGRLVYGVVLYLWTTKLGLTRIMVVDEAASKSDIDKSGCWMATPETVRLSVLDVATLANHILNHKYDLQKVSIVAKRPETSLLLVEAGVPIKELNVGNMSQTDKTRSITKSMYVVDEDIETSKKLDAVGVYLMLQMVSGELLADFMCCL